MLVPVVIFLITATGLKLPCRDDPNANRLDMTVTGESEPFLAFAVTERSILCTRETPYFKFLFKFSRRAAGAINTDYQIK